MVAALNAYKVTRDRMKVATARLLTLICRKTTPYTDFVCVVCSVRRSSQKVFTPARLTSDSIYDVISRDAGSLN